MSYNLVHCGEGFITRFPWFGLILVDPAARVFLFDRWTHVPEEGSGSVRMSHVMVIHVMVHV